MTRILGLLCFALLLAMGGPLRAEEPALQAIGKGLVSHRATYGLSIARHDPRNYRSGIGGGLTLEFLNTCDGYVLNQRFVIETQTDDGPVLTDMTLGSFESLDGRRFQFRLREQLNGEDEEELVGEGQLSPRRGGGRILFSQPADTALDLPEGTMFPTEHTIRLIEAGRAGQNLLQADVFDGSGAEGHASIGGFIGRPQPPSDSTSFAGLKGQRSWRVRLAYFSSAKKSDTPDYEIAFRLYENGVSDDIVFDYGDYAIRATMQTLEVLPRDGC
ncbi:DUF1849 family protein [Ferrovibrio sp.]|uniref:EipB family protein n=1 Tax=Ferrovibrio sp. TaxID=1917215 RepID=UPI001B6DC71B|nr:DUF1849 family protein [Ferrovibrio sp.]MBP7066228.1 cell envelope integrity EipB family protein [Ferrovibrio sp.]